MGRGVDFGVPAQAGDQCRLTPGMSRNGWGADLDYLVTLARIEELAPRVAYAGHNACCRPCARNQPPSRAPSHGHHRRSRWKPRTAYDVSLALFPQELPSTERRFAITESLAHLEHLVLLGIKRRPQILQNALTAQDTLRRERSHKSPRGAETRSAWRRGQLLVFAEQFGYLRWRRDRTLAVTERRPAARGSSAKRPAPAGSAFSPPPR
jgi:hypothetical protein